MKFLKVGFPKRKADLDDMSSDFFKPHSKKEIPYSFGRIIGLRIAICSKY